MAETRTFRLGKLVRDKIVEMNEAEGAVVEYRELEPRERLGGAAAKLAEEALELAAASTDSRRKELADILASVGLIRGLLGVDQAEADELVWQREVAHGGFSRWHYIDTITLPADSPWADYYAADPQRFPEVFPDDIG